MVKNFSFKYSFSFAAKINYNVKNHEFCNVCRNKTMYIYLVYKKK